MKVKVRPYHSTTEEDSDDDQNHVTLRQLLRPSLVGLAIGGCYTYDPYLIKTGKQTTEGCIYRILGTVYRLLFLCVGLATCTKWVAAVVTAPNHLLILSIVFLAYFVQNIGIFMIALKCDYSKYGGHRRAFDFWDDKIRPEMEALGIHFPVEKIRKRQNLYLSISIAVCVSSTALTCAVAFNQFTLMSLPFRDSVPVVAATVCSATMFILTWTFPLQYIIMVCTVMKSAFESFNRGLEDNISQDIVSKTFQFQRLRKLHLNLSKMVLHLDKDFGVYFAFIFLFVSGFVCIQLYAGLKLELGNLTLFATIFIGLAEVSFLGLVAVFAAWVHEAVSKTIAICHEYDNSYPQQMLLPDIRSEILFYSDALPEPYNIVSDCIYDDIPPK